ncbi:MAG TPA: glutathione transferase GstA [Polyangia bacterium]|nr:glutathione transferase GstA [Polyangia bacterium]
MKLYFTPGACSLSPHIALREANLPFELEKVDLGAKRTKSGADYKAISPKGYVPALQLDDGQVLTEGPAIVQYIADRKPESKLAPQAGTLERYRLQEWLNFISTEVHKTFSPLFNPKLPEETRQMFKQRLAQRFDFLEQNLDGKSFLLGDTFTVADGYVFVVMRWAPPQGFDLGRWPNLKAYVERIAARPAVRAALEVEGLSK